LHTAIIEALVERYFIAPSMPGAFDVARML
jgi:hypothetical protein